MLYHLDALISPWMCSFLYEDEPSITYFEQGLSMSAYIDYELKNRMSNDYFSIIGSKDDRQRLVCLGVAPHNIVELGGAKDKLNAKALPRDYIPFFADFEAHDEDIKTGPNETEKKPLVPEEYNTADFVPRDHLFGRCESHERPLYAYKHPSSPSITPYPPSPKSHTPKR
jgi:hypothetical protein